MLKMDKNKLKLNIERFKITTNAFETFQSLYLLADEEAAHILNCSLIEYLYYKKDVIQVNNNMKLHLIMMLSLVRHGIKIFGHLSNFNQWINIPNIYLKDAPIKYLKSKEGVKFIDDFLTTLEYGDNV